MLARIVYSLALWLLLPWALLHLLLRGRKQPEYLRHWGERFGRYGRYVDGTLARPAGPLIWIHAVSVGETRAAQPLVKALQQRFPDHHILLTHMTPTGRQTSVELFGDSVQRVYLAYDYPGAVARFLDHWQPTLGIVMETELWPNLLHACAARRVPVLLANARLSERSAGRYRKLAALVRLTLGQLAGIAAQSKDDAERLRALGAAQVKVIGNLKFDIPPPEAQLALGDDFRHWLQAAGPRPVVLCASTREGEEALLLAAWQQQRRNNAVLVIAPRHPQRFDTVAELVRRAGLRLQRRSDGQSLAAETDVWLADSMGEMFAGYAAADVVIMGGSLLDFGSQNLIEPCAVGRPVLLGPSTYNFAQAAADALAAGAAQQGADADAVVAAALALLDDGPRRERMGIAGLAFTERHRGATARTVSWIEALLAATR